MDGRSVTACVQWLNLFDTNPKVHCTPLLAHNGKVDVWMVVIVDDDEAGWRIPTIIEKIPGYMQLFGIVFTREMI